MILEGGREYLFVSKQGKFEFEQADGSQYSWVGARKVSEADVKEKEYQGEGFSRCFILVRSAPETQMPPWYRRHLVAISGQRMAIGR